MPENFHDYLMVGKVKYALCLLSDEDSAGMLPLNSTVMASLVEKHPKKHLHQQHTLINGPTPVTYFLVHHVALKLYGATGPSELDAFAWRRMCTSFKWLLMICVMLWLL